MIIKAPQFSALPRLMLNAAKIVLMYASVFMLFFLDSGFYAVQNLSGTVILILNIAAIVGLMITSGAILKIKKKLLLFYVLLLIPVVASGMIFSSIKKTTILIICLTVGFAVANFIDYSRFKKLFKEMMLFLSVFSLFAMLVWAIFPSAVTLLPLARQDSSVFYNAFFSIISTSTFSTRNYGLFWEPGAFAIFLNIALLYEMSDKKQNLIKMLIFMITVVTTLSTLGIICLVNLVLVYLFNKNDSAKNHKRNKTVILLLFIAALIYVFFNGGYFIDKVFGKLTSTDNGDLHHSTATRINAIIYPFKAFIGAPLFGVGYTEFTRISIENCESMATCTFLNWLAIYGIFGVPFIFFCVTTFIKSGKNIIAKIGLLIFSVLLFSTESFLQIGFVYIFVFYGIQAKASQDFSKLREEK